MNLGLLGYGKMGKIIEKFVSDDDKYNIFIHDPLKKKKIGQEKCDVFIDFSVATAVSNNIEKAIENSANIIIGTTGWEFTENIKNRINESDICVVYDSNFSISMNLFQNMLENFIQNFNYIDGYDISGLEMHHRNKKDAPSGTAKTIVKKILKNSKLNSEVEFYPQNIKPDKNTLQFSHLRCGSIKGVHKIIIDSEEDMIELTHRAHGRGSFAKGALMAAEWSLGKKGIYKFNNVLNDIERSIL